MKYLTIIIIIFFTMAVYVRFAQVYPLLNIPDSNSSKLSNKGFVFTKSYTGSTDEFYKKITKIALSTLELSINPAAPNSSTVGKSDNF